MNSVTQLVFEANDELLQEWKSKFEKMVNPVILVEDISPDTCFSLFLFQAKISGTLTYERDLLETWVEYCSRWEQGDMITTGAPFQSWGALHNALSHDFFINQSKMQIDEAKFQLGFTNCNNFLMTLLNLQFSPFNVPSLANSVEYQKAKTLLRYEYHEYAQSINHADIIQLELPIKDSNKTMIIDAYISEENRNLGSQKVFLRNDEENTWLKSGFGLMAIHNPNAVGTGNDMTVSVEPTLGVHLTDLWVALEQSEDLAWDGKRPCDEPRYDDSRSKANEPWFDENKKCTIIAAPRKVNGEPGTKLTWADVVETLWKQYSPVNHILVEALSEQPENKAPCLPHECKPMMKNQDKHMLAMKWSVHNERPIVLSPTAQRYFAACANAKRPEAFPHLEELPSERAFDFMPIPGGFVVIHENGVLFFDDWSKEHSKIDLYTKEYHNAYRRYETINEMYDDVQEEIDSFWHRFNDNPKRISAKEVIQLNNRITKLKLYLRKTLLNTIIKTSEENVQDFRETLEKRWGINRKIDDLYESVSELETIVKSHSETHTNQLINGITIFGFPFVLFSSLLQFLFSGSFTPQTMAIGFLSIITASVLMIIGIKTILRKSSKLDKRAKD